MASSKRSRPRSTTVNLTCETNELRGFNLPGDCDSHVMVMVNGHNRPTTTAGSDCAMRSTGDTAFHPPRHSSFPPNCR
jgi:hypothetical protein